MTDHASKETQKLLGSDDILKADLTKLHSEINQFRNQEFWVCSFAIAIFGTTAREVKDNPLLGLCVLLVLLCLLYWHHTLTDTRNRLLTYLKITQKSHWELKYRKFADSIRYPSQRLAALFTFLGLGIFVPILAFHGGLLAMLQGQEYKYIWGWWPFYSLIGGLYIFFLWKYGLQNYKSMEERHIEKWRELLKTHSGSPVAPTRGSSLPNK